MKSKSVEDYIKEIAEKINNGKCHEIENPTKEDVLSLKEFDYILTEGKYFPVMIRRSYMVDTVFNIPTVFWKDGFEIGDNVMGMLPETYTAEEVIDILEGYKGVQDDFDI